MMLLIGIALTVSTLVYVYIFGAENDYFGMNYIYKGGPIVILLMMLSIMVVTFIFERIFLLRKAYGLQPVSIFIRQVKEIIRRNELDQSAELTQKQRGSCAAIIQSGIDSYLRARQKNLPHEKRIAEMRRAIEESTALEIPLLEKNLIALSTIASIATLVGLLGTTIGMIRAFKALAQVGAPDAVQLSIGISEALINTAGGLAAAIIAIVAYNYFVNKVDSYIYEIEEAGYDVVELLSLNEDETIKTEKHESD
jgi:biopolymer transport protein ExbB